MFLALTLCLVAAGVIACDPFREYTIVNQSNQTVLAQVVSSCDRGRVDALARVQPSWKVVLPGTTDSSTYISRNCLVIADTTKRVVYAAEVDDGSVLIVKGSGAGLTVDAAAASNKKDGASDTAVVVFLVIGGLFAVVIVAGLIFAIVMDRRDRKRRRLAAASAAAAAPSDTSEF